PEFHSCFPNQWRYRARAGSPPPPSPQRPDPFRGLSRSRTRGPPGGRIRNASACPHSHHSSAALSPRHDNTETTSVPYANAQACSGTVLVRRGFRAVSETFRQGQVVLSESTACSRPSSPGTQAPVAPPLAKNSVKHRPYWAWPRRFGWNDSCNAWSARSTSVSLSHSIVNRRNHSLLASRPPVQAS